MTRLRSGYDPVAEWLWPGCGMTVARVGDGRRTARRIIKEIEVTDFFCFFRIFSSDTLHKTEGL